MQQIAFKVFKKQHVPATGRWPDFFIEWHTAFFQFGFGCLHRIHAEGHVTVTGKLVVTTFRQFRISRINFKPTAAGQGYQACRRVLTIVEDFTCAQNPFVPALQSDWVGGGNGDVLNGDVH